MRDSQRSKVYNWQPFGKRISIADASSLVREICPGVTLVTHGKRGRGAACYSRKTISMPDPNGYGMLCWTDAYILHECAHWVNRWENGKGIAPHGPEFVRVFIDLLTKYTGHATNDLEYMAELRGVRYA